MACERITSNQVAKGTGVGQAAVGRLFSGTYSGWVAVTGFDETANARQLPRNGSVE